MFTLICVWINGCVNNRKAGDLRRYCAHYGITVMVSFHSINCIWNYICNMNISESVYRVYPGKERWQCWLLVSRYVSFHTINCIWNYICNMNISVSVYTVYPGKERWLCWWLVSRDVSFHSINYIWNYMCNVNISVSVYTVYPGIKLAVCTSLCFVVLGIITTSTSHRLHIDLIVHILTLIIVIVL